MVKFCSDGHDVKELSVFYITFAWNISGTLVFRIVRMNQFVSEIVGQGTYFLFTSPNFAEMSVSQEDIFWSDLN